MPAREQITRPRSMSAQLASRLTSDIENGRYQPGEILPSEAQMVELYGVGKHTVRAAISELRRAGLIEVRQGKGSIVLGRASAMPPVVLDRSIRRTSRGWRLPEWHEAEAPAVSRITLEGAPAAVLEQPDQDAICIDRTLRDPDTGTRTAHRMIIPMSTAAEVPELAEQPDAQPVSLYHLCAQAGIRLNVTEHVTARLALPDERAALGLMEASPLLVAYRVAADTSTGRPLLLEEIKAGAMTTQFTYALTPTQPKRPQPAQ